MDSIVTTPAPRNEPVRDYRPGSAERISLVTTLTEMSGLRHDLTQTIDGEQRRGGGTAVDVVAPHRHAQVLGSFGTATADDAKLAVDAALRAGPTWRELPFEARASVLLRAADLLSGPWRDTLNAATMLGQSKTVIQAEIDSACELADFWRFNVHFARRILAEQPESSPGVWNRMDHRPLEGFVYAITPFNFTAIAGNLPTAPALMGNTVIWKPSPTQTLSAWYTMRLLEAAGMPPGVINMMTGDGAALSEVLLADEHLAGIHFTGSTATFQYLWGQVGANISQYRGYPRLVGETGGKDFVLAHPSAESDVLRTALVRGAFEYSGQKCSAASRAYLPRSLWRRMGDELIDEVNALTVGDVTELSHFTGAVIDRRAFTKLDGVLHRLAGDRSCRVLAGGTADGREGYFVRPTVVQGSDPGHEMFRTEYFGPLLAVYVYEDSDFDGVLELVDRSAAYGLTGAVIGTDRVALTKASEALRFTAGNFYLNDRPTGAVVGQQPFGGSRASGTNDKAGSILNLLRWTSPRSIKENLNPPTSAGYPHQK
jgi:1-pyrroline-5-carboxylate dehydrogenase